MTDPCTISMINENKHNKNTKKSIPKLPHIKPTLKSQNTRRPVLNHYPISCRIFEPPCIEQQIECTLWTRTGASRGVERGVANRIGERSGVLKVCSIGPFRTYLAIVKRRAERAVNARYTPDLVRDKVMDEPWGGRIVLIYFYFILLVSFMDFVRKRKKIIYLKKYCVTFMM